MSTWRITTVQVTITGKEENKKTNLKKTENTEQKILHYLFA